MRLKLILMLCCVGSLSANSIYSQQQKIDVDYENKAVVSILDDIKRQTGLRIVHMKDLIPSTLTATIAMKGATVEQVLNQILSTNGFSYEIDQEVIIITRATAPTKQQPAQQRNIVVRGTVVGEDGKPIPGVTVSVNSDGTDIYRVTDSQGVYSITFRGSENILFRFSHIGKKHVEIRYTGQQEINPVMADDISDISEVVVTGYGVVDKRMLTSSISTIKREDLEMMGALTVDRMMEGKVPGLMIMNVSSQPGAASKVRVRNSGTFTGSREPLWVVDGIIYEDPVPLSASDINSLDRINLIGNAITGLNPQDIESINILKDASATALYGTRAANGVIVVTTRRGKEGPATVSYAGSLNVVDRPRYKDFNLMNSKERIDVSREIAERGLIYPDFGARFNSMQTPLGYEKALKDYWNHGDFKLFSNEVGRLESLNYDWFKDLYRPAVNQTHSVNVSGGTETIKYYFSVGYDDQRGTERGVDLNRLTSRVNLDINLRKNVLVTVGMDGNVQKAKYNRTGESAFSDMPYIFNEAYYTSRAIEAKDPDGNLVYIDKFVQSSPNFNLYENETGKYNILHERDNYRNKINNKAWNVNVGVKWDIFPWLTVNSRVAYRNTTNLQEEWVNENTYYMAQMRGYDEFNADLDAALMRSSNTAPFGGLYSGGQVSHENYTIRNQLRVSRVLRDHHFFTVEFTQEANSTKYNGTTNWESPGYNHEQGRKFISLPDLTTGYDDKYDVAYTYQSMLKWFTGQLNHSVYPTITQRVSNSMSYLGVANYSYRDKYIGNFNIRSDGSNTFGQYQRYKFRPTWSVSGRWNIHNEDFLQGVEKIDELALRISYGFRGTAPSGSPYLILYNYGYNNSNYYPETTANLSSYPNGNLKWERTSTVNAGLNYSLFGNRLYGAIDYDFSKSKDLLLTMPVSLVNGFGSKAYNGGSKNSHTIEFDIHGEIIRTSTTRWNMNFNITHTRENILSGTNVIAGQVGVVNYLGINGQEILMKGFPVDGFFSYRYGGLDDQGAPIFPALSEDYGTSYEKLQNLLVYSGRKLPKFYGGFGTQVSYKEFTLSANFSYKVGQKVRLLALYPDNTYIPLSHQNMRGEFVNRWRKPGDHTDIPRLIDDPLTIKDVSGTFLPKGNASLYDLYDYSDLRTARGDFIRWQSLTLSYRCPQKWLLPTGLRSAIIRLQVQNMAVWSFDRKLKGQDPEQQANVGLPSLPSFNLGLNIGF